MGVPDSQRHQIPAFVLSAPKIDGVLDLGLYEKEFLFYKEIFGNLLFSYVLRPGTVFFLGFDSNYDRNSFGRYDRRNDNVFVKFSYWWRA